MRATQKPVVKMQFININNCGRIFLIPSEDKSQVFQPTKTGVRFANLIALLNHKEIISLHGKTALDLCCGTGLLGIVAAKKGAHITCTDIVPATVDIVSRNSVLNDVQIKIVLSDTFNNIDGEKYDFIICNPPSIPSKNDLEGRYLLDTILEKSSNYLNISGQIIFYETSNVDFKKTDKLLNKKRMRIIYEQSVIVCLNRTDFWETYSQYPLDDWVLAGLALKRNGNFFLKGRFIVAQ